MTALLISPWPWWIAIAIGLILIIRRERAIARKHDEACANFPNAPVYSLETARSRRKQTCSCGPDDSPQGRPASPFPVGPSGDTAA